MFIFTLNMSIKLKTNFGTTHLHVDERHIVDGGKALDEVARRRIGVRLEVADHRAGRLL
jgi:hypothetical protein